MKIELRKLSDIKPGTGDRRWNDSSANAVCRAFPVPFFARRQRGSTVARCLADKPRAYQNDPATSISHLSKTGATTAPQESPTLGPRSHCLRRAASGYRRWPLTPRFAWPQQAQTWRSRGGLPGPPSIKAEPPGSVGTYSRLRAGLPAPGPHLTHVHCGESE